MKIIYSCANCSEELEVADDSEFKISGNVNHDPDWTIQDFDCHKCGYENTIKIFCEVE